MHDQRPLTSRPVTVQFAGLHWSSMELGYLNSIFYLGYVFAHIPSGFFVHRFSATK
jgi:fucose permease